MNGPKQAALNAAVDVWEMNLRRVRSFFGFVFMLVLVKIEISGQTNSVPPENENFQYLRREEQEKNSRRPKLLFNWI
tara:strand:- start:75 stop:305 length:231 start_codon:yes stop_codon:yes gene_type:complete